MIINNEKKSLAYYRIAEVSLFVLCDETVIQTERLK
jgi:hypothetical protein